MNLKPVKARAVEAQVGKSLYPEAFAGLVKGRTKRKLGNVFGLERFGVNLTELAPGAVSALAHFHSVQDEFIYVLEGELTLLFGDDVFTVVPGECCGFKGGTPIAHQLENRSDATAVYLEIGDRSVEDNATFPNDDLKAVQARNGSWTFTRKDGRAYD